jgi:hypothetical protein
VDARSRRRELQPAGPRPAPAARLTGAGFPALLAAALIAALLAVPGSAAAARVARLAPAARPAVAAVTAAAAGSTDLYVSNASGSGCSDSGSGTQAQPFCTIAAAAAAVQPGQTVIVEPGEYGATTISASGTAADPITFLAADTSDNLAGLASIGYSTTQPIPQDAFVISGAHDVVISGFDVIGDQAILIENSSDITINGGAATGGGTGIAAIQVTGTSSDVTVSRVAITTDHDIAVEIDQGVTGAVVTTNTIDVAGTGPGVLVTDAPGTDITSNTVITSCRTAVEVTGTSTGTSLENNIAETGGQPPHSQACTGTATGNAIAFSISATSTPQTVANYNLIDPVSGGPLYVWGGTSYTSLASFTAATGQGANDIAASPGLDSLLGALGVSFWFPISAASAAIDSADADAPGELSTDQLGNPRADDPLVPNTGTGPGYYDRGAVELQGGFTLNPVTAQPDPAGGPLDVTASATPLASTWTTNGPIGTYEFLFSDGTLPVLTSTPTVNHVFSTAGQDQVQLKQSFNGYFWDDPTGEFIGGNSASLVLGANYKPVYPEGIFDTRNGVVVPKGAIPPGGSLTIPVGNIVSGLSQVSAADISAIAVNVTVTEPTAAGDVTVNAGAVSGAGAGTSNINFSAGQTIANLVTVPVVGGDISVFNNSKGTVQVLGALQGVYSNAGSGYQAVASVRVLDTRNKIGVTTGPLPPHGGVRLNLSGRLPAGAAAAVLNLTATQPTAAGFVVAYPDGQSVPSTSSLNFTAGRTVANQVIVPLTNDVADFWNSSDGTVQLVGDLVGYYAAGAAGSFVPYGPVRIADTRHGFGTQAGAVPAHGVIVVSPDLFLNNCTPSCPLDSADVLNVTVTQPTAAGFLTVYADNKSRPGTSSVNFSAGQTIASLVTTQDTDASVAIYNGSSGTVQIIVDEQGYFINQP